MLKITDNRGFGVEFADIPVGTVFIFNDEEILMKVTEVDLGNAIYLYSGEHAFFEDSDPVQLCNAELTIEDYKPEQV